MLNGSSSPSPSSSSCAKHRRLIQAPHPGHRSKGNSSCRFFGIRRIRNYDFKIFCSVSLSTGSIRKPRGLLDPQYDLSAKWAGIWSSDPPWWIINGYSNLAIEFIPSVQVSALSKTVRVWMLTIFPSFVSIAGAVPSASANNNNNKIVKGGISFSSESSSERLLNFYMLNRK